MNKARFNKSSLRFSKWCKKTKRLQTKYMQILSLLSNGYNLIKYNKKYC